MHPLSIFEDETMPSLSDVTLSLRVPSDLKKRLERASVRTHRSRAYLTIAALQKYLNEVEAEQSTTAKPSKLDFVKRFRGVGAKMLGQERSAQEIDATLRDLRNDE
jgi:uridine kinase